MDDRQAIYDQILRGFTAVSRFCRQRDFPEELQTLDLTMAQLKAIWFLQPGQANMSRIASALGVALPSATATVDRLVQRGLVRRHEDPTDRRLVLCSLTEKGVSLAGAFEEFQRTIFTGLLASLTDSELATVLEATAILRRASSPLPQGEGQGEGRSIPLQASVRD